MTVVSTVFKVRQANNQQSIKYPKVWTDRLNQIVRLIGRRLKGYINWQPHVRVLEDISSIA